MLSSGFLTLEEVIKFEPGSGAAGYFNRARGNTADTAAVIVIHQFSPSYLGCAKEPDVLW